MPSAPANSEHDREGALLNDALDLPAAERRAFLDRACAGHPELRQRLQQLLDAYDAEFLEQGAAPGLVLSLDSTVPAPPPEELPESIGRYRLVEKLGEGGFGSVYLAEQREPFRRRVALKIIKLGMDTRQIIARFEAERQALAMMDHPNIAKVLDAGTTESGRPYFVMELIRGIKITEYCDQKRLPTRERLELFLDVCRAVQHAHQKGIIHRDLKPSNILVTLHDGVPVPKVIDFGIAKATQQELTERTLVTHFQQFLGTPAYMSPEQAEMSGLDIDTRADIYSLGVLLYELLTGVTPFDGKELLASGLDAMRRTIREDEPARPSTRVNTLTDAQRTTTATRRAIEPAKLAGLLRGDLDWIVMKCLEKDRNRRYETATGLARDLERHLTNEPVIARPPSTVYQFQKMVRRNKMVFTAAGAVLVALVFGLAVALIGLGRERLAKRRALVAEEGAISARNDAISQQQRAEAAEKRALANLSLAQQNALQANRLLYNSDINLAQKALQSKHLGLARRLLARHVPPGGVGKTSLSEAFALGGEDVPLSAQLATNDLRSWEWRYLWQQCQSPATRLCKLQRGIAGLSFATNGDWLAVTMLDGRSAELWSRAQGRRLQVLTTNGCGAAQNWKSAFSPVAPLLAIGVAQGAVLVTNFQTGAQWTLQTGALQGDTSMMADKLAFSPDGRYLAALGGHWWGTTNNGTLFVWETGTFSLVSTNTTSAPVGDGYAQGGLGWMPNSQSLWIGARDSSFAEVPALGGPPARGAVVKENAPYLTLAVSPLGDTLATTTPWDPTIQVWNIRRGPVLAAPRLLSGHASFVSGLAYSPDGRWLASGACDQTVRLWDTTTWESIELRGHTEEVHAVVFTSDSQLLASGSRDGEVLLWRLHALSSWQDHQRLPEHVDSAVIAPGSRQLLARLKDKSLALIDARTMAISPLPFSPADSRILGLSGLAVISDGTNRLTFIEVKDQGYRVLGQTLGSATVFGRSYVLQDRVFVFLSGSSTVACVPVDDVSRRFELSAGPGVTNLVRVGFLGPQLFGRDEVGGIRIWDLKQQRLVRQIPALGAAVSVLSQPALPDLMTFNRKSESDAVEFRDLAHPERVLSRFVIPSSIHHNFEFSSDGQLLAMSIQDTGSLLLFDLPSRTKKRSLQRHLTSVRSPRFSPDGTRLASGGALADNVKLWDVETGQELLSLATETSLNSFVQFSEDGNLILGDGWHLWRAPTWEEIAAAELAKEAQPNLSGQ